MIFGFADPAVNAVNAQVCKLWLNLALDALWEEIDDLPRLLSILSPLKRDMDSRYYEFEHPPSENDWKRFEKYATRVRRLNNCHEFSLGDDAFEILDQTRRRLEILPNLRALKWGVWEELRGISIFMHSRVRKFAINLRKRQPLQIFFMDVVARMPDLAILDISSMIPARYIQEDLIHLLQGLPKLQSVTLPCFCFTTKIAECLSHAEHLSSVDFHYDYDSEQVIGGSADVALFNPTFIEGAFPLLSRLSILVNFDDAARFVETPFSPNKLAHYYNDSYYSIDSPDSVRCLLSALSENYQLLEELELSSSLYPRTINLTDNPGYITLDTLRPIFKLPHLVIFQLHHLYPLLMTQEDVECLASSCPALENLSLGVSTVYLTEATLTLSALIPFAQHCPNLKYLGLFMDATAIKVPEISLAAAARPFKSLQRLCVGHSIIDEWLAPAIYFSHLLAPDCEIKATALWNEVDADEELCDIIEVRGRLWNSVKRLVPVLSKSAQERRHMRAIVEELRANVAMLQDPMAIGARLDSLLAALA
ncbi:hypothetical protein HYPSUDRAFT_129875 [Hypholoma sublateritium FD-334 SS-4]|uniref:F-box domain-containing protein n=1 Tax=Hypholoma sublateritium (strain FD-334 SS-4) TaxID=945553 RepID=A0A0D2Q873_HYPSF|nr:hypothetical protein HYPSUDRAFT_129875 [Hypholoma sublateritium FD-334 SS-4]